VLMVSSPRLGSINHTLAALEALDRRNISLVGLVYNLDGSRTTDPRIVDDSRRLFSERLSDIGFKGKICDVPDVSCTESYCVDFSVLFN
jgi:dethiobiotin synthetase